MTVHGSHVLLIFRDFGGFVTTFGRSRPRFCHAGFALPAFFLKKIFV
jgi:hypothetical protein